MQRLRLLIDQLNREIYNPQGLNILWPQRSAFLFVSASLVRSTILLNCECQLEIEYYVCTFCCFIRRVLTQLFLLVTMKYLFVPTI